MGRYIKSDRAKRVKEPKPPLGRIVNQGFGYFCAKCLSSCRRIGFLGLFGERLCINPDCENSKSKFVK